MKLKRYSFFSFVFIILVGLYIYSFNGDLYSLDIFGVTLVLPIAVWVILPLVLFYIASFFHMMFYGFSNYFAIRKYETDYKSMIEFLQSIVLNKDTYDIEFKTKEYKNIANFILSSNFIVDKNFKSREKELDSAIKIFNRIENGEYIKDLKLSKNNPLYLQNLSNRLKVEPKFAIDVLKSPSGFNEELVKNAYIKIIEDGDKKEIFRFIDNVKFDRDLANLVFEKYKEGLIELSVEKIKDIVAKSAFGREDFIHLANMLKVDFEPDTLIAIFEALSNRFDDAEEAYIYILLELELIDKAKEILDLSNENEFLKLKAYLALKEAGEHFQIELFI